MNKRFLQIIAVLFLFAANIFSQNYDNKSTAQFGKMWSFDNIPVEKINKEYNVNIDAEWYNTVMKSALQLGNGCSASFVSEFGLIMTNHHCVRDAIIKIQEKDEDFLTNGFYAADRINERKIPGMFADQLMNVFNVTDQVLTSDIQTKHGSDQFDLINLRIDSLEQVYNKKYNLVCKIIPLYSGAKYILHCYKRYTDLRLVMVPEFQIASTGWDWDNFTYPRYELDFAFLRAYDSLDTPCKTEKYFKWSEKGAEENELTFVIGRPGNTDRLLSSYQLKYIRDYSYAKRCLLLNKMYSVYEYFYNNTPNEQTKYLNNLMGTGNSKKSYAGNLAALKNSDFFVEKNRTEEYIQDRIMADTELAAKYGHVFEALKTVFSEMETMGNEYETLNNLKRTNLVYFDVTYKLFKMVDQLMLPDSLRAADYKDINITETKRKLIPEKFNDPLQIKMFAAIIEYISENFGKNNFLFELNSNSSEQYCDEIIKNSFFGSKEKFEFMLNNNPDDIYKSNDPLILFYKRYMDKINELLPKVNELYSTAENLNRMLGEMYFKVYGTNFSPDATSSLRISDGVIKGYEYNGTLAPGKTTYYGMYDRYLSFGKKQYPWGLPLKWQTINQNFDLSTPLDFSSTHDIVGGNSGSAAINVNKEIIGLIFDGNYESLAGNYFYSPINNRAVGVNSGGLLYALKMIYKADNLVNELNQL